MASSRMTMEAQMDSQKELFYSQIDEFQKIVVRHCRLTCVNPLQEEMTRDFLFAEVRSHPTEIGPPSNSVNEFGPSTSTSPVKRGRGRPKGSKNSTKKVEIVAMESKAVEACPGFVSGITEAERESGNQEIADSVLMRFDAIRRRFCQLGNVGRLLDTAVNNCKNLGVRTNMKRRIGPVPGVHVGDVFYVWGEMNIVGLHHPTVSGIAYMKVDDGATKCLVATSVVTSVHPGDETAELETLVYTGSGGTDKDQRLERGNLALRGSYIKGNDIRVIRGQQDPNDEKQIIYMYDGLYKVSDFWKAEGELGFEEFKVRLVRNPNQPSGYAIWKEVESWRMDCFEVLRNGFLLQDLSCGKETSPIPVLNEVDGHDRVMLDDFEYITSQYYSLLLLDYKTDLQSLGCNNCQGHTCGSDCRCLTRNDGKLPYQNRVLVCRKPMVYECGEHCSCSLHCNIRLLQSGLKIRVEVFKTEKCGWGLRSWDPIRAGTFICEFAGVSKTEQEVEEEDENDFLFDTSRVYKPFRWNFQPELAGEDYSGIVSEAFNLSSRVLISAKEYGNTGRFINHSCSPNVFWQPIEYEKNTATYIRIGLFAMKHIPPLTELTYDYGMSCVAGESGEDGSKVFKGKKICLCGSDKCRGSFG